MRTQQSNAGGRTSDSAGDTAEGLGRGAAVSRELWRGSAQRRDDMEGMQGRSTTSQSQETISLTLC